jgi:hypothetical protein
VPDEPDGLGAPAIGSMPLPAAIDVIAPFVGVEPVPLTATPLVMEVVAEVPLAPPVGRAGVAEAPACMAP